MDIKTQNGMGIKPKGIAWKPNYGMGLPKNNGMGLAKSNGMGISKDQNYFKFNEYERKRKYLQMGSHKPSQPKPKPQPKQQQQPKAKPKPEPKKTEPAPKPVPAEQPKPTKEFNARKKWGAAVATVAAAEAFNKSKRAEKYTKAASPEVQEPQSAYGGQSVGSIMRTMSLFEQLLYV